MGYDQNKEVSSIAMQLCKFLMTEAIFLQYQPTQLAAGCCILSINIHQNQKLKGNKRTSFFTGGSNQLNTDIWNNSEIKKISGYSILDIKNCLHDIATFAS
jgi:uncharacterized protein (DUF4213/DUF364 family)